MSQNLPTSTRSTLAKPRYKDRLSLIPQANTHEQNYVVYRVKQQAIEITQPVRNAILTALNKGQRHIQVGQYTIMLNSISSIEPMEQQSKPSEQDKRLIKISQESRTA